MCTIKELKNFIGEEKKNIITVVVIASCVYASIWLAIILPNIHLRDNVIPAQSSKIIELQEEVEQLRYKLK